MMAKVIVTFKTPDAVDEALQDITNEEELIEMQAFLKTYIKYNEYVRIEFDTVAKTATVLPQ
jgi:hypothetical protein